jgi:hypothetical protein
VRDFSQVRPSLWTGETGRALRGHTHAQLVQAYLLTCGSTNLAGLYYLPLPLLCHDLGLSLEDARRGLQKLAEPAVDFARYDEATSYVWVINAARESIGTQPNARDKRLAGVRREVERHTSCPFYAAFKQRYASLFADTTPPASHAPSMPHRSPIDAPPMALASPFEAPSMPLACPIDGASSVYSNSSNVISEAPSMPLACPIDAPSEPHRSPIDAPPGYRYRDRDGESGSAGALPPDARARPPAPARARDKAAPSQAGELPPEKLLALFRAVWHGELRRDDPPLPEPAAVADFAERVANTAALRKLEPAELFAESLRLWASGPLNSREKRSPVQCFAQAFGEVVDASLTSAPSAADALSRAAAQALGNGQTERYEELQAQLRALNGGGAHAPR